MKIAVIGNSHVGMLRAASAQPEFAGHDFVWMAKASKGLERAEVDGTRLAARDTDLVEALEKLGMASELDLAACDLAIFVAFGASAFTAAKVMKTHVVPAWLPDEVAEAMLQPSGARTARQFITEDVLIDYLVHAIRCAPSYRWISALRAGCDTPVRVVPQPFPATQVMSPGIEKHRVFKRIRNLDVFEPLAEALHEAHRRAFGSMPGVKVVLQDPATVEGGMFTRPEFTRESTRLDLTGVHVDHDTIHANPVYGAQVLRRILADFV